jgi:hypothetical protein
VIEHCDVFDTVRETGDHGSFNSWGRDRFWLPDIKEVDRLVAAHPDLPFLDVVEPVVLRNNRWRCDHGWDIDLDDGSSHYRIENNLCLHGGLKLREGFGRTVENNVIVNDSFHPHVWFADSRDVFRRNLVMTWYKPIGMPPEMGPRDRPQPAPRRRRPGEIPGPRTRRGLDRRRPRLRRSRTRRLPRPRRQPGPGARIPQLPHGPVRGPSPALRTLARTPVFPVPRTSANRGPAPSAPDAAPVGKWLGARWKRVTELGEISAAGLPGAVGIVLLELPADSAAARAGFRSLDVVLDWNGEVVREVGDLENRYRRLVPGAPSPVSASSASSRTPRSNCAGWTDNSSPARREAGSR